MTVDETIKVAFQSATIANLLENINVSHLAEILSEPERVSTPREQQESQMILFFAKKFQQLDDIEIEHLTSQILKKIEQ